jgi:hypothetical protein
MTMLKSLAAIALISAVSVAGVIMSDSLSPDAVSLCIASAITINTIALLMALSVECFRVWWRFNHRMQTKGLFRFKGDQP